MKKFILVILAGLVTWGIISWINFTNHPNWLIAGLIIGGLLALAVVALMIKVIFRFIKWAFTSCLYLSLITATLVILTYASILPVHVGLVSCVVSSGLLVVIATRRIAEKAQISQHYLSLFSWIIGYPIQAVKEEKVVVVNKTTKNHPDRQAIIDALMGYEFGKREAQEATDYALTEKPDASLEDKIVCALGYMKAKK